MEPDLPTSDLSKTHADGLLIARQPDGIAGCVAVESYVQSGRLRSLAIAPGARGADLGGRLVAAAQALARERGVRTLYLPTTTAGAFFATHGYAPADVPESVRQSSEFVSACPASAACPGKSPFA